MTTLSDLVRSSINDTRPRRRGPALVRLASVGSRTDVRDVFLVLEVQASPQRCLVLWDPHTAAVLVLCHPHTPSTKQLTAGTWVWLEARLEHLPRPGRRWKHWLLSRAKYPVR